MKKKNTNLFLLILGLHSDKGRRRQTQTVCHQLHARHVLSHLGHVLQSHIAYWEGQCAFTGGGAGL